VPPLSNGETHGASVFPDGGAENGWCERWKNAIAFVSAQIGKTSRTSDEGTQMTAKPQAACIRPGAVETDPRWARVLARDRSADGQFWYSVATTGVYCRPSCPSKAANPRNVGLHASLAEARATGFRPCRRCNPEGPPADIAHAAIVAKACRLIEESEEVPSLKALAQAAKLSTSYFHRLFKSETGLTPKDYAQAHQASRVRDRLTTSRSVTEAIYGAGFNSSGRFYEKSRTMLGMTPTQYRAGGANEDIRFALAQSSLGAILVASSDKGVASILTGDDPDALVRNLRELFPKARLIGGDTEYESMVVRAIGRVETLQIGLNLPRDVRGTAFRRRVWLAVRF
jgi:AraC family transcriptional regulator, regulatory protein of adaptative response / methylated-DNA-[protein]-cysteine methyltransferase